MISHIIFDWGSVLAPGDVKTVAPFFASKYDISADEFVSFCEGIEDRKCHTSEDEYFFEEVQEKFGIPREELQEALSSVQPWKVHELAKPLSKDYSLSILSNQLRYKADAIRERLVTVLFYLRTMNN